ncbi:MBL fold metallo-hydrolase [Agarilytica rhodophyticola]|uniref:MBL fold metallo-hydrolase n=1 Tax=Agarilytica rhodophyticola TaxID=1737490 RepID=UPI000B341DC8|nr:MBL fold metallo-hydrolase [Agarilytica rhodophyticola]
MQISQILFTKFLSRTKIILYAAVLYILPISVNAAHQCDPVSLAVLGSGGPELDDGRNSSGFAILLEDKARVLVDTGMGTSREFERMSLKFNDVQAVLITHLHVDHVNDLPVYVKGSFFTGRAEDLQLFGPWGNEHLPSMESYIKQILDKKDGLYPYLHRHLPEYEAPYSYNFRTQSAPAEKSQNFTVNKNLIVSSLPTSHGALPSVAWKVNIGGCHLAFMGDSGSKARDAIAKFVKDVDLLVLNMPIEVGAPEPVQALHMVPEDLAVIAKNSKAKKVVLAHFMKRSLKNLSANADIVSKAIKSTALLAKDGDKIPVK